MGLTMKRNNQQRGAYSYQKGARFERECAEIFSQWAGCDCRRTPRSGAYGSEGWGWLAGDLMFKVAELDQVPCHQCQQGQACDLNHVPFYIELKRREGWTWAATLAGKGPVIDWWAKCRAEAETLEQYPLLVFKRNRGPIWVAVRFGSDLGSGALTPLLPVTYISGAEDHDLCILRLDRLLSEISIADAARIAKDEIRGGKA